MLNFFIHRPALASVVFLLILVAGLNAYFTMPVELYPPVSLNEVEVWTRYPGTSPEEMEELVTIPLEDALQDLADLEYVESTSSHGLSLVRVSFEQNVPDMDEATRDVQRAVDSVTTLPEEAEDPEVFEIDTSYVPVVYVTLGGPLPPLTLRDLAEDLADELEKIPGVSRTSFLGAREREVQVIIQPERLTAYGISVAELAEAIRRRNVNVPAGTLQTGQREQVLRVQGEAVRPEALGEVAVRHSLDGRVVYVRDVATVREGIQEVTSKVRLNGREAVVLLIGKKEKSNTLRIIREIKRTLERFRPRAPLNLEIGFFNDTSRTIQRRLTELKSNGLQGFVLIVLVLGLSLGLRRGLFAAIGINTAFLITFVVMNMLGYSINFMTLFALVLVLGMLDDDNIVIIENITRYMQEQGLDRKAAAIAGLREVAMPVILSSLTTCAAFVPMLLMSGDVGAFMSFLPKVVTFALLASLFEGVFLLPSHLAEYGPRRARLEESGGGLLFGPLRRFYLRVLPFLLRRRWFTFFLPLPLFLGSLALIPWLGVEMFPEEEPDQIFVDVEAPSGATLEYTERLLDEVAQRLERPPLPDVETWISSVGTGTQFQDPVKKNFAQVTLELVERQEREQNAFQTVEEVRQRIADVAGVESLRVHYPGTGPPVGKPVNVRIVGKDYAVLEEIAAELKGALQPMEGVYNIEDDRVAGDPELHIQVDEAKVRWYGVDFGAVVFAVRAAYAGQKVSVWHEGGEEIDVVVKGPEELERQRGSLENLALATPTGGTVRLGDLARLQPKVGVAALHRRDQQHVIRVLADLQPGVRSTTVNRKLQEQFRDLPQRYPGYELQFGGEAEETTESFQSLYRAFGVALIAIFCILTLQFNSLAQPLLILLTVPLAAVGVIFGLVVMGTPFGITAMVGLIGLAGIAVNNGLVLIEFINERRIQGLPLEEAIMEGARLRMRPIMLTAVTTVLGLLPMAMGWGGRSEIWSPMAASVAWGLTSSCLLMLLFLPVAYLVLEDVLRFLHRLKARFGLGEEEE